MRVLLLVKTPTTGRAHRHAELVSASKAYTYLDSETSSEWIFITCYT